MQGEYQRGDKITLYANFLTSTGEEPTTIVDPTTTIEHVDPTAGTTEVDVNAGTMTQLTRNAYYYSYTVPSDADIADYLCTFMGTVDTVSVEATDVYHIKESTGASIVTGTNYSSADIVSAFCGIDSSKVESTWLAFADTQINAFVRHDFLEHTGTAFIDIMNARTDSVLLPNYPIISVGTVWDDGTTDTDVVEGTNYEVYLDRGEVRLNMDYLEWNALGQSWFTKGLKKVKVVYTYGYEAIPTDITYVATLLVVKQALTRYPELKKNITEQRIGDYTVKYTRVNSIDKDIQNVYDSILERYRQKHLASGGQSGGCV